MLENVATHFSRWAEFYSDCSEEAYSKLEEYESGDIELSDQEWQNYKDVAFWNSINAESTESGNANIVNFKSFISTL